METRILFKESSLLLWRWALQQCFPWKAGRREKGRPPQRCRSRPGAVGTPWRPCPGHSRHRSRFLRESSRPLFPLCAIFNYCIMNPNNAELCWKCNLLKATNSNCCFYSNHMWCIVKTYIKYTWVLEESQLVADFLRCQWLRVKICKMLAICPGTLLELWVTLTHWNTSIPPAWRHY